MIEQSDDTTSWQIELLRMTAFVIEGARYKLDEWWAKLPIEPSDTKTVKEKENIYIEEGSFHEGKLTLAARQSRIDWLFGGNVEKINEGIPTLGEFPNAATNFFSLCQKCLTIYPGIKRLALGVVLSHTAENEEAALSRILKYLHWENFDLSGSTDFLYQINRPRLSSTDVKNLQINRLSKWSVIKIRKFEIMATEAEDPSTISANEPDICMSRVELDINTSRLYSKELPHKKLRMIFNEMASLSEEISIQGDIK